MTTHPELAKVAQEYLRHYGKTIASRHSRDAAIRDAHAGGMGIREIARVCEMDTKQVMRVLGRA